MCYNMLKASTPFDLGENRSTEWNDRKTEAKW